MKSSKTFNNISDELKKEIPKLKHGETVVFKMLNGVPNPEPDEKERSKDPVLYPKIQLLTKYRIFDKYKDEYVDVGWVKSWNGDTPQAFGCFVTGQNPSNPKAQMPSRFQGKFELKGGVVEHEELFEILYLSPQRKGTPCPDNSIEQIFEIQDTRAESKAVITKVDLLKKAIAIVDDISPEKAREVMSALNQPTYTDDEVLLAKTKEFALNNVQVFLDTYGNPETVTKSIIRKAVESGLMLHDSATGEVKLGEIKIAELKMSKNASFVDEFSNWIKLSANGKNVLETIKTQVSKKNEKVTA